MCSFIKVLSHQVIPPGLSNSARLADFQQQVGVENDKMCISQTETESY